MKIQIRNTSQDPIYLQIQKQLREAILKGELEEESMLPSIRFLAKELRVSVITTKRAYDELEREGLIYSIQGKGSFVAAQSRDWNREQLLMHVEKGLDEALHYAQIAGLSHEELVDMLRALEEEHDERH